MESDPNHERASDAVAPARRSSRQSSPSVRRKEPSSSFINIFPVGTRVYKEFDEGWFWGEIVEPFDNSFYFIRYSDGDEETQTHLQVTKLVRQAQQALQSMNRSSAVTVPTMKETTNDGSVGTETTRTNTSATNTDGDDNEDAQAPIGTPHQIQIRRKHITRQPTTTRLAASSSQSTPSRSLPKRKAAENVCYNLDNDADYEMDDSEEEAMPKTAAVHARGTKKVKRTSPRANTNQSSKNALYREQSSDDSEEEEEQYSTVESSEEDEMEITEEESDVEEIEDCKPPARKKMATTAKASVSKATSSNKLVREPAPHTTSTTELDIGSICFDSDESEDGDDDDRNDLLDTNGKTSAREDDDTLVTATKGKKNVNGLTIGYDKAPYSAGNHLPIISDIPHMFDDMIQNLLADPAKNDASLIGLLSKLHQRPLRIATMCSGTESPILALDMIQTAIRDACRDCPERFGSLLVHGSADHLFPMEHVFSCEIEPFKQAYIERNFSPPILFRDIRELGQDRAQTAYGSMVDVPNQPGSVDILIAGTSCVDYSNLNNQKVRRRLPCCVPCGKCAHLML
jgi:hypothetical protein